MLTLSKPKAAALSPRERQVLCWAANGKSTWEIGRILGISPRTVNEFMSTARRKLDAVNRAHAVAIAVKFRLV